MKAQALTTVVVPKAGGVTSTKAVVVRWLKRQGDRVDAGEPLVELETEKESYQPESPCGGVLVKILARETAEAPVGDPLCHIERKSPQSTSRKSGRSPR